MHWILYQPGAAGDLVAAVIDSRDFKLSESRIVPLPVREKYTPRNFEDIDRQMAFWSSKYNAVATQYYEYYSTRKLDYILIDTAYDIKVVEWCLRRAEKVSGGHHPFQMDEVMKTYMQLYFAYRNTNKIIDFRDIINGNLITVLKQWVDTPLNEDLYHAWLKNALTYFPFDVNSSDKQNTSDHLHLS